MLAFLKSEICDVFCLISKQKKHVSFYMIT